MTTPQDPQGGAEYQAPSPYGGAPYGAPPQYAGAPYGNQPRQMSNGLGVAGLVCGIIAIVLCFTVFGGIILGILGLVFGIIGKRRADRGEASNGGMALAGAITGGIGIILSIALVAVGVSIVNHAVNNYRDCIDNATTQAQVNTCQQQYLNNS